MEDNEKVELRVGALLREIVPRMLNGVAEVGGEPQDVMELLSYICASIMANVVKEPHYADVLDTLKRHVLDIIAENGVDMSDVMGHA